MNVHVYTTFRRYIVIHIAKENLTCEFRFLLKSSGISRFSKSFKLAIWHNLSFVAFALKFEKVASSYLVGFKYVFLYMASTRDLKFAGSFIYILQCL